MNLYHKQLNSLEELRREREQLRASIGKPPQKDEGIPGGAPGGSGGQQVDIGDILINILSNEVVVKLLLKIGVPVVKKAGKFAGKNIFELGKEVLGGYAKWKALEISYRWVRRYWLNKKHQKEERRQQED